MSVTKSESSIGALVKSLDGLLLYTLTFKRGSQSVHHTLVAAKDRESAQRYGKQWCDDQINCRFISIEEAIPIGPWTMEDRDTQPAPEPIPTKPPVPVPVTPAPVPAAPAAAVSEKRR